MRVMVFNPTGRRGDEEITLVNPRLLSAGRERVLGEEGCLSFPRIFAPVEVRRAPRAASPVPGLSTCSTHLGDWDSPHSRRAMRQLETDAFSCSCIAQPRVSLRTRSGVRVYACQVAVVLCVQLGVLGEAQ